MASTPSRRSPVYPALVLLAGAAALLAAGCTPATPILPERDTAPSFVAPVADQTYTVGEAIAALILPQAQGGNGELSYTLEPAVPGLRFDPGTRVLAGTPSLAGSYGMSYRAEDGDDNRAASDAATASFTITVEEAEPEGILDTYRGSGDQIFMLNRAGESLDGTPYTLVLDDEASAEVYLIATNTNDYEVQPRVERLDDAVPVATSQRLPANASRRASRVGSDSMMHARPWLLEFNNSLPPPRISTVSPELPPRQAVREGDTYTFYDTYADGTSERRLSQFRLPHAA